MSDVRTELDGDVAIVTLHRPPANFLDHTLVRELADALHGLDARAAVLTSAGRHFCAGADLGAAVTPEDQAASARRIYTEAVRLFRVPIPVIAAVHGAAVGGGVGLACAADFRVAATTSRFHCNFTALGFHPGFGLSVTLPRIVGTQRAAELLCTARKVDGAEAVRTGLADRLADGPDPLPEAVAFARTLAQVAPLAVRSVKQTLRGGLADEVAAAVERELAEQTRLWATDDCAAGIAAVRDRVPPVFTGR